MRINKSYAKGLGIVFGSCLGLILGSNMGSAGNGVIFGAIIGLLSGSIYDNKSKKNESKI